MRLIIETVKDNNRPGNNKYQVIHDFTKDEFATHMEFNEMEDVEKYIDTFKKSHPKEFIEIIKIGNVN